MNRLFDSYIRWRHSRGFGIHSTFGYYLITDALYLRRPYSYYAESLPALEEGGGEGAAFARRLYRTAIFLRQRAGVRRIGVIGSVPEACLTALTLAGLRIGTPGEADPTLYFRTPPPDEPFKGLRLDGRRWSLLIPRPQMAYTHYILP